MDSLQNSITEIEKIILLYRKNSNFNNYRCRYNIPFSALKCANDVRLLGLYIIRIKNFYFEKGIKIRVNLIHATEILSIVEELKMHMDFAIHIPYGTRSKYFRTIYDINNIVDVNGFAALLVDNTPYSLSCVIFIEVETKKQADKINSIIREKNLKKDNSFGSKEIFTDLGNKKWDIHTLPIAMPFDEFSKMISMYFWFAEEEELQKRGYSFRHFEKKKVFISYAHKDKITVYDIVDKMEECGLNVWIDKQRIDVGDRILDKISEGMDECDLAIIFISQNTKDALFAQHELKTFFSSVIYKRKNWFIVRLDDTDPNEICFGLSDFLYFDFNGKNTDELIESISEKLNKNHRS